MCNSKKITTTRHQPNQLKKSIFLFFFAKIRRFVKKKKNSIFLRKFSNKWIIRLQNSRKLENISHKRIVRPQAHANDPMMIIYKPYENKTVIEIFFKKNVDKIEANLVICELEEECCCVSSGNRKICLIWMYDKRKKNICIFKYSKVAFWGIDKNRLSKAWELMNWRLLHLKRRRTTQLNFKRTILTP